MVAIAAAMVDKTGRSDGAGRERDGDRATARDAFFRCVRRGAAGRVSASHASAGFSLTLVTGEKKMAMLPFWPERSSRAHSLIALAALWSWAAVAMGITGIATNQWADVAYYLPQDGAGEALQRDCGRRPETCIDNPPPRRRLLLERPVARVHLGDVSRPRPLLACLNPVRASASAAAPPALACWTLPSYAPTRGLGGALEFTPFLCSHAWAWERTAQGCAILFVVVQFFAALMFTTSLRDPTARDTRASATAASSITLLAACLGLIATAVFVSKTPGSSQPPHLTEFTW